MKLNRLFEIVYILLNKKKVTAKELSEKFEVSPRTIYRDIDVLSSCGIPVYASKGKGGGISLLEGYKIDKAMLTTDEQKEILSALQSIHATDAASENNVLSKLSSFFNAGNTDWIEIDFSSFSANSNWKNNFENIKQSIINTLNIKIKYTNLKGELSNRKIEPIKLIFKGGSWYLYAYCRSKNDYRMFKLNRIISLELLDEKFAPHENIQIQTDYNTLTNQNMGLVLLVNRKYAYRIFDDFDKQCISQTDDGNYMIKTKIYDNEWIINYILSLGDNIECIQPVELREKIAQILKNSIKKYL